MAHKMLGRSHHLAKIMRGHIRGHADGNAGTTIDQQVRDLSKVVGYGINWALQDLEIEEMNALLS